MSNILFQLLDITSYDDREDEDEPSYNIRMFGRTINNETVYFHVTGFKPYFYILLDKKWSNSVIFKLIEDVKKKVYPPLFENDIFEKQIVEKHNFYGFTNYKKFNFMQLSFKTYGGMKAFARVLNKKIFLPYIAKKSFKIPIFESNIIPYIRFLHTQNIDAVGWVSIDKKYLVDLDKNITCSTLNYMGHWSKFNRYESKDICKFVIGAFDLECTSGDGSFPQATRDTDKIIQIGLTLSRFGEPECFEKYILTLNQTSYIMGATVICYDKESDLLLGFRDLIRKTDPDIITGYNIFSFDFDYLMKRSELLKIQKQFSQLSRITNECCEWMDDVLTSSALGENIMRYYKMTGRVIIDLLKVVKREYKLQSYKLDDVASNFIRDKISKIEVIDDDTIKLNTKNTYGLSLDQYVSLVYHDGIIEQKYKNGHKFKIKSLDTKSIILERNSLEKDFLDTEFLSKYDKVYWCQNKDDVTPNDIFRLFEKTAEDRAIIAKYCIQDCVLCNKLINKLQVITNNISMGLVCCVPLSFLFLRGQGIKIFSLVSKKCREKNHLIPVLKRKLSPEEILKMKEKQQYANEEDDEESDEDNTYEGATVLEPKTGVHFEPVPVLDYASLYPNSMIFKNLSHECFVNNTEYMGLTGYTYHKITYTNQSNEEIECYFAEKQSGDKGIIPEILMELLAARKKYKKEMENENDPFKKSILDCLQLAYKVTANSLYGQTGARVSAIFMKEIAASTTAIGRDMLLFSKYFIEKKLTLLIDLALTNKNKFFETIAEEYNYYPHIIMIDPPIRVNTKEGQEIHKNKFEKKCIGYECVEYDSAVTKYYEANKDVFLNKFGCDNIDDLNTVIKAIRLRSPLERQQFYEENEMQEVDSTDFIYNVINDMGYSNKNEMFEKFYITMNYILKETKNSELWGVPNKIGYYLDPEIIYGDTDSIFFCGHITSHETGLTINNKKSLCISIVLGIWASIMINTLLPAPMAQEYEKVMWPLALLSKKRYVGNLYEKNPDVFKEKSMGIVMKRRDNAPIVKIVVGGIINEIINNRSAEGALKYTTDTLQSIITGKYNIDMFVIAKTLRSSYADRTRIVHAVLADRMAERDPGNKPESNDRIPYVFVETTSKKGVKTLQGNRVETPSYIIKHKLKIDYLVYITNQIMKPALQFLELFIHNPEQIFKNYIIREENRRKSMMPITYYMGDKQNIDVPTKSKYSPDTELEAKLEKPNVGPENLFSDKSNMSSNISSASIHKKPRKIIKKNAFKALDSVKNAQNDFSFD
jgi:DNA polymerase elongation subunit (family B)